MKRVLPILIMLSTLQLNAQESVLQLSLADCYTMAKKNSPLYAAKQLISKGSDAGVNAIQTARYPQLNFTARASYQSESISIPELVPGMPAVTLSKDQYKTVLDVSQLIYDGGVINANKALLIAQSTSSIAQTEIQLDAIRQQVNEFVIAKMLMQKQLEVLQIASDELEQHIHQMEQAIKNGVMLHSDEQKLQVAMLKLNQQKIEALAAFDAAAHSLNHLLGLADHQKLDIVINLPDLPMEPDYQHRSEMNYFSSRLSTLDAQIELNKNKRRPILAAVVQGGYGRPGLNLLDDSFQPWYFAGITLKWQLWDWQKTGYLNQGLAIQKKLILNQQESLEYNLENARITLLTKLDAFKQSLAVDDTMLTLQKDIVSSESNKLNLGMATTTDYLSAVNDQKEIMLLKETHTIQLLKTRLDYLNLLGLPKIENDENE